MNIDEPPPLLHYFSTKKKKRTRRGMGKKERDQSILSSECNDKYLNLEHPFSQDSNSSLHDNSSTTTTTTTRNKRWMKKRKQERYQTILSSVCNDEDLNLDQPFSQDSISSPHDNSPTTTRKKRTSKRKQAREQSILSSLCNVEDLNLEQPFDPDLISSLDGSSSTTTIMKRRRKKGKVSLCNGKGLDFRQGSSSPLDGNSLTTTTTKEKKKKEHEQAILGSWYNGEGLNLDQLFSKGPNSSLHGGPSMTTTMKKKKMSNDGALNLDQLFSQDSISPLHGNPSMATTRQQKHDQAMLDTWRNDEDLNLKQLCNQNSIFPLHSNSSTTITITLNNLKIHDQAILDPWHNDEDLNLEQLSSQGSVSGSSSIGGIMLPTLEAEPELEPHAHDDSSLLRSSSLEESGPTVHEPLQKDSGTMEPGSRARLQSIKKLANWRSGAKEEIGEIDEVDETNETGVHSSIEAAAKLSLEDEEGVYMFLDETYPEGDMVIYVSHVKDPDDPMSLSSLVFCAKVLSSILELSSKHLHDALHQETGCAMTVNKVLGIQAVKENTLILSLVFTKPLSLTVKTSSLRAYRIFFKVLHHGPLTEELLDEIISLSGWVLATILELAWALDCVELFVPLVQAWLAFGRLEQARPAERLLVQLVMSFVMGDANAFKRSTLEYILCHSPIKDVKDPCHHYSFGIISIFHSTYRINVDSFCVFRDTLANALATTPNHLGQVKLKQSKVINKMLETIVQSTILREWYNEPTFASIPDLITLGTLVRNIYHFFPKTIHPSQLSWQHSLHGLFVVVKGISTMLNDNLSKLKRASLVGDEDSGPWGDILNNRIQILKNSLEGLDLETYSPQAVKLLDVYSFTGNMVSEMSLCLSNNFRNIQCY